MFRTSMRSIVLLTLLVLLAQACSMPGTGTPTPTPTAPLTLFVATTGNDANDCLSTATACQSLYHVISYIATPGSTIHIGAGTFSYHTSWEPRSDLILLGAGVDRTILASGGLDVIQLAYPGRYEIRDLSIVGTHPDTGGGNGIEVRGGATLILDNCSIRGKYWGVRLLAGATAAVSHCSFEGNFYGVANFANLTLSDSTFTTNQIALDNHGQAQVQSTSFDNNGSFDATSRAASPTIITGEGSQLTLTGGSISNSHGYAFINNGGAVSLVGVDVHNNVGMAIWHQQGTLEISSSIIRDNGAYGIDVGSRSGVTDVGTVDVHETAVVRNGSAGVRIDGGIVSLENVTVSGNRASSSGGGGIWMDGGQMFLLNSTVAFNTGHGIHGVGSGVITARRSVVALNSTEECYVDSRYHTDYGTSPYMCSDTATAASLGLGPLTTQAGTLVHPLLAGSPLIDAGGPVGLCPDRDQRDYVRPAGATCDVGAYEWNSTPRYYYVPPAIVPASIRPTDTPAPTPTVVALSAPFFIFKQQANCRIGPNTLYDSRGYGQVGQQVPIEGLSDPAGWYYVLLPDGLTRCFVAGSTGDVTGPLDGLQAHPAPPLPVAPGAPTLNVSNQTCNTTEYVVRLSWKDVDGEDGYRVYRDGTLIATLGANTTSYDDTSPDYSPHEYRLESYNAAGSSSSATLKSEGCLY